MLRWKKILRPAALCLAVFIMTGAMPSCRKTGDDTAQSAAARTEEDAGILTGVYRGDGILLLTAGLLPGALLLLLSAAAKEAVGRGDGYCFLILGALCGPKTACTIAAETLFLASLSGIALMILRKAQRKTRLPFLLFAGAAWAGDTMLRLSGIRW